MSGGRVLGSVVDNLCVLVWKNESAGFACDAGVVEVGKRNVGATRVVVGGGEGVRDGVGGVACVADSPHPYLVSGRGGQSGETYRVAGGLEDGSLPVGEALGTILHKVVNVLGDSVPVGSCRDSTDAVDNDAGHPQTLRDELVVSVVSRPGKVGGHA